MFERFIVAAGLTVAATSTAQAQDIRYFYGDQFSAQSLTTIEPDSPVLNGFGLSGIFEEVSNYYVEPTSHLIVAIPKEFFADKKPPARLMRFREKYDALKNMALIYFIAQTLILICKILNLTLLLDNYSYIH